MTLAVLVLAGCVREPAPPTSPYPAAPTTETAGPTIELPPRPQDVPLDGLDPCTLLTEEQQQQLGLKDDREPLLTVGREGIYNGVTSLCTARGYEPRAISVGITTVTTSGIERFTDGGIAATVTPIDVRDFPALLLVPPRPGYCTVIVDVAPGQLIDVQFADGGNDRTTPTPELCEAARQTAGLAVDSLLAMR